MMGWSIIIDLFHGVNHSISVSIRQLAVEVAPFFHQVVANHAGDHAAGMDLVCRIMYDAQQDYFSYANALGNGLNPQVPTFQNLIAAVKAHRVSSLFTNRLS